MRNVVFPACKKKSVIILGRLTVKLGERPLPSPPIPPSEPLEESLGYVLAVFMIGVDERDAIETGHFVFLVLGGTAREWPALLMLRWRPPGRFVFACRCHVLGLGL